MEYIIENAMQPETMIISGNDRHCTKHNANDSADDLLELTVTYKQQDIRSRSSQSNLFCVLSYKLNFGTCSFRVAAPTIWNSLWQTFVNVHFMALLSVSWKPSILIMLFSMLSGPLVTPHTSDSMFYPLTLCALQIVFMIMIKKQR